MTAKVINKKVTNKDEIEARKIKNDQQCEHYSSKFGLLKKAQVLMQYGRINDAF